MNIALFNHKSIFVEPRCNFFTGMADALAGGSGGTGSQPSGGSANGDTSASGGYVSTANKREVKSGDQYGMAMLSGDYELGGTGSGARAATFNFTSGGSTSRADQVNESGSFSTSKLKWIAIIGGILLVAWFFYKKV